MLDRDSAGNYSIVCLSNNGTPSWRFDTSNTLRNLQVGSDGRIYFVENPGEMSFLVCLLKGGSEAWQTMPDGSDMSVSPIAIFDDGTVLAKSVVNSWVTSYGYPEWVVTDIHLTAISENGTVLWKTDFLASPGKSFSSDGPLPTGNATLQVIFFVNNTQTAVGLNSDGSVNWTCKNDHDAYPGTLGPDNVVYYVENYDDQAWGNPTHPVNRISCWNTSTGKLEWQLVQDGWAQGPYAMSDHSSTFIISGELVTFGSNGSVISKTAYPSNDADLGALLDQDGNGGKLYTADSSLSMTDASGNLIWQFPVGSTVKAGALGNDGRIIVMTDDYAISIHKPALTTTMNYFVVLLAIDLFVSLMSTVRIIDMMWPQAKSKVQ